MPTFDAEIWSEIAPRFRELRGEESVDDFLGRKEKEEAKNDKQGIKGLHWNSMEDGRAGMSCESLFRLCQKKDVSPNWLLFGIGPRSLKRCKERFLNSAETSEMPVAEVIKLANVNSRKTKTPKVAKGKIGQRVGPPRKGSSGNN